MQFEWDEEKNRINKEKHDGIGFELAIRIFLDDKRLEFYDEAHSSVDEDRWNTIGMVGKVLFVVYTERSETIRIISARRATREEERKYYDGYEFR